MRRLTVLAGLLAFLSVTHAEQTLLLRQPALSGNAGGAAGDVE